MDYKLYVTPGVVDGVVQYERSEKLTNCGFSVEFHNHPYETLCDGLGEYRNSHSCWSSADRKEGDDSDIET